MKFALAKEHLDFFYQRHYVEFENLISSKDILLLKEALEETVAKRLRIDKDQVYYSSLQNLFLSGFDSWRDNKKIKKILLRSDLAEVASHLVKKNPIRMGFDQILMTPLHLPYRPEEAPSVFHEAMVLKDHTCLQGIVCGLILNLGRAFENPSPLSQNAPPTSAPLPEKPGSGVFFAPNTALSLPSLLQASSSLFLLIAYTGNSVLYKLCKKDLHTHTYKKMGYVFGDQLSYRTHPILYQGSLWKS
jgi:hypothetical protein